MLTPEFLRDFDPLPSRPWLAAAAGAISAMQLAQGTRIELEGFVRPAAPVLFATNSTQRNDFIALRAAMHREKVAVTTVTKARTFHEATGFIAQKLGTIPLASRGYVILIDFVAVNRRRPTDAEYRQLRDHLDRGVPLPEGREFEALSRGFREILGHPVDLREETWAQAVKRVYAALMAETLRLMRVAVERGHCIQMYPEGTVSPCLGVGRIGAVQAAHALGLDIVPVGMNGCPEAIRGDGVMLRKGTIRLRFGAPLRHPVMPLPPEFRAFVPDDERRYQGELRAGTELVMSRIDQLLDPRYRRPSAPVAAPPTSTHRFL